MTEALAHNNMKIVKILAEQGADINIKNNEGMTALDVAKKETEIIEYLESLK